MKSRLMKVAASGVGAIVALCIGALALPAHARVERQAVVRAPASTVRALLSSTAGFQRVSPFREQDPGLVIEPRGPARGVGAGFAWHGPSGSGTQTVVLDEPDRVAMRLDLGPMGRPLQTFTLRPTDAGTIVSWRLDADLGANPFARFAGLFMDRMLGATYERGLQLLAREAASVHEKKEVLP